jgi:hypothetical protein
MEDDALGEAVAQFLVEGGRCPLSIANAHVRLDYGSDESEDLYMQPHTACTSSARRFIFARGDL